LFGFAYSSLRVLVRSVALAAVVWVLCAGVAVAAPNDAALAQRQASEAKARLEVMRAEQAKGISAYDAASDELVRTRAKVKTDARRLAAVRASLASRQRSLDSQASFLYRTGGIGFVQVLFGSATFDDFASRLSVLKGLAGKDAGLVVALQKDRDEAAAVLRQLKAREAEQAKLVARADAQRDGIQSSIDSQETVISSLSSQAAALLAAREKASNTAKISAAPTHSSSSHASSGGGGSTSGSTKLTHATVEGRDGSWWVMEGEPTSYRPTGVSFKGGATTYSVGECGTGTASGHPLNDSELTCAHRTLPFGTRIAVSRGSQRIIVKVTDRGPYTSGKIIDLTKRGARLLGVDGVGTVKCEVVRGQ
jgi:rare lipoprotein A (peptidoglycan hydrolase)